LAQSQDQLGCKDRESDTVGDHFSFPHEFILDCWISTVEDNCRTQAIAQVCAFHSPFLAILSDMEIYQEPILN
jgi:hypothetical protein